ncbi:stage VI sporulation protein D [Robertmurraya korlensis]|uniref:stage VI sporulation protein D n=1 Tax=Robertmurraya korlensis TaxID=519977 RepID=UPI00203C285F|nr:stage VI sporulation protein D [Robertmurraya korlensis]MCM3599346.1 stage VI sporulation protein D [Robertmurraya korlensis]
MSQGNESCLRFSLEESVWFQKGQEVEELVSISLDPNITIHENEQYVTIQGALELTGEYQRYNDGSNEEEDLFAAPKFVHHVEEREEGLYEFSHRFPVDITIPNNRIQSINDIHVEVESFDYLFQERSCMKLTADLTITGLYGDQQHKPAHEEAEVEEVQLEVAYREATVDEIDEKVERSYELRTEEQEEPTILEHEYEPFAVEARKSADDTEEKVVSINKTVELFEAPQLPVNEAKEPEITFSAARSEGPQEVAEEIVEEEPEVELQQVPEAELEPQVETQPEVEVESSSSPPPQPKVKKKKSSKKGMSLTEFFARKEETEDLTKLRVAIVQSGETVEQLASRYEVPVQQLLKVNHLELNQDIYEGQVLYIPIPIAHK